MTTDIIKLLHRAAEVEESRILCICIATNGPDRIDVINLLRYSKDYDKCVLFSGTESDVMAWLQGYIAAWEYANG